MSNSEKIFECSFCGNQWACTNWKKYSRKKKNIFWTEYKSICSNCSRETTVIEYRKENLDECNN